MRKEAEAKVTPGHARAACGIILPHVEERRDLSCISQRGREVKKGKGKE